jgi:pantothenate kinase
MIHKFRFFVNDIESEIFEYDENDFEDYDDLIYQMEQDRIDWIFDNINSGYKIIKDGNRLEAD